MPRQSKWQRVYPQCQAAVDAVRSELGAEIERLRAEEASIELHLRHIGMFGPDDPQELRRMVLLQANRLDRLRSGDSERA